MNRELWPHQAEALTALRQTVGQGIRRIVLQAPTGSGKTLLSAAIIEGALAKGRRVAFVVSGINLVDQTVEALYREDIRDVGVVQSNHAMENWGKPVQVCSIQTIAKRRKFPCADVVIIDECHVLFDAHKEWLRGPGTFIGLSATPYTKKLGQHFDTMITVATTQEMIDKGILCPFRTFSTGHPDLRRRLRDVKLTAGDYQQDQLGEVMREAEIAGDVVTNWQKLWGKDKTLVFAVDVAHAQTLQRRFLDAGISCGYQDATTPVHSGMNRWGEYAVGRTETRQKFHSGEYRVVVNVATLTTGVDWDVRCLSLARPTKSEILYKQIVGRALRTAPGKDYALILDHGRVTQELGFVTDIERDELHVGRDGERLRERAVRQPKECPSCHMLKAPGQRKCINCGFEPAPTCSISEDGEDLEEVAKNRPYQKRGGPKVYTMGEKADFMAQLKSYARNKGYAQGWAANKFREKFGVWPNHPDIKHAVSQAPTPAVLSWIRSSQIRWARSQQRNKSSHAGASPT